jgi:hypothetical protein
VVTEVVVIVFESRRPVRGKRPLQAGTDGPACPRHGRAGINGDTNKVREGIVDFFLSPGGTAPYKKEPAVSETVPEPRSGRGQKVVAEAELRWDDYPRNRESEFGGVTVFQAALGRPTFDARNPSGRELVIAADLSATHKADRTETPPVVRPVLTDYATDMAADVTAGN